MPTTQPAHEALATARHLAETAHQRRLALGEAHIVFRDQDQTTEDGLTEDAILEMTADVLVCERRAVAAEAQLTLAQKLALRTYQLRTPNGH